MFCLFKNSKLTPPLNLVSLMMSWGLVLYWSHFAFIEKEFLEKVFTGDAMFVDLLFGLPIVLIFAIVIYAMVSWSFKVLIILLYPAGLIEIKSEMTDTELAEIASFNDSLEEDFDRKPASSNQKESPQSAKKDLPN